jgi:hypothetical protein
LFAAAGKPVMPSRPEPEITRSFASRWIDDARGQAGAFRLLHTGCLVKRAMVDAVSALPE